MNLQTIKPTDYPLTIDECLRLLEKETAESERQLKRRQLEIIMRLRQKECVLLPNETLIKIANAMIVIVKIRLYGPESLLHNAQFMDLDSFYELLGEVR